METNSMQQVRQQLARLEKRMQDIGLKGESIFRQVHPLHRAGALNLLQYLALRNEDIRDLQDELHQLGLSSLASSESHILHQVQAIRQRLGYSYLPEMLSSCGYDWSRRNMQKQARLLFGTGGEQGIPSIMVSFDAGFAGNVPLVKDLLQHGMNIARINSAADDETTWLSLIRTLREACRETGKDCKLYMDLPGPKLRSGLPARGNKKGRIKVKPGDHIWLAEEGCEPEAGDMTVSIPEKGFIRQLKKGERVFIDDGIVQGRIESVEYDRALVSISKTSGKGKIKSGKSLNFPDSCISSRSLAAHDKAILPFICEHADLVGYSFVRTPEDLRYLQDQMRQLSADPPAIIIKIENLQAVNHLPELIFQGMSMPSFGLMIARGDLAVEIGFERLGEIQEEILWLGEAAQVPVIWATQVLENLNKTGVATRAEITDASHAALADCVMINKGNHTLEVLKTLRDILKRTGGHHNKKRYIFRPLRLAENFLQQFEKNSSGFTGSSVQAKNRPEVNMLNPDTSG